MPPHTGLYRQDFYAWTQAQAALLDARQFEALDLPHLIEELTSLGNSEKQQFYSRFTVLLTHLLKLHLAARTRPQDLSRAGRGWRATVKTQRLGMAKVLRANPRLRPVVPEEIADAYEASRVEAAAALEVEEDTLPPTCPWIPAQVMDVDFWPEVLHP